MTSSASIIWSAIVELLAGRGRELSGRRATRGSRASAGCGVAGPRGDRAPSASAAATPFADAESRCRVRTRARRSRMCAGGIHDSGSRPINNSSRRCRASAQSVFARFFLPFSAAASAGSARCTSAPTRSSSSTTNRQPVVASSATSRPSPRKLCQELPDPGTVRRRDPRARHLAGDRVDPLRRDLRTMLIHPHHDRHHTTSPSRATARSTHATAGQPRKAAHRIP